MKHRVNRLMTVAILTGGLLFAGTGVSAATFKDLNKDFLAKDEISYFVEHEIIKGNPNPVFSDVSKNHKAHKKNHPNKGKPSTLTKKEALELFTKAKNSYWYVVMGGEGKRNKSTFTHNNIEYRYMAESLNTMKKLKAYLGKTYTSEQVTALIKKLGIIERKGVLAQPNADGGSILNWEKASMKETSSTATTKKFTLNVPLGDTKEVETLQGELRYEKGKGWRVHSLETILSGDTPPTITPQKTLQLFKESQNSYWYVVRGGDGKRNETTFNYKGKEYRYMANSLNTMKKLKTYLGKTYTSEQVTALIKKLGIIEYKGVLAQPNADGGSILNWEKATMKETSSTATTKKFTLNVPLGDTKEVETLQGELRYEKGKGWRVHNLETILNSDTPPTITSQQARSLFVEAKNSYWYVVRGGDGKRNEATFTYKGMDYRYMAESLNTMKKLKAYLGKTYTSEQVTALIKNLSIIEHKGVLAQPNADGGSLLNWKKAKIKETSSSNQAKHFEIDVPIGESSDYEALIGELRYVKEAEAWLVHRLEQRMSKYPK
ncbi:MAG: DL-endopeptidase inhibitor IseA family protein [Solibacillus sp.]